MKKVLHIATECYPAAKAGGMGDVVGALPLYLPEQGIEGSVIIPKYDREWFENQPLTSIYHGSIVLGGDKVGYEIYSLDSKVLGYPFYCVDIPGLFDRKDIYLAEDGHGYRDEGERNISFQLAVLHWLMNDTGRADVLHCHDHMTGLIPFFVKYCPEFDLLAEKPTVFTIHNGQYRGVFDWSIRHILPSFDDRFGGLLDWDGHINSLAAAIKCAWRVNTVSPSYMDELISDFDTLTPLVRHEREKCRGIINGIDHLLWDPATDAFLHHHLHEGKWKSFKAKNKNALLKRFGLKSRRPLIGFIGRMAHQKGADLLQYAVEQCLNKKLKFSTIILGSGDKSIEGDLCDLARKYPKDVEVIIAYDEGLARAIYAGCDYLMMPSRFEPCGLNQMYAMRYGTIPIVSHVGGLKDTVPDIKNGGHGIVSRTMDGEGFCETIERAIDFYDQKSTFAKHLKKIIALDYSWSNSADKYTSLYMEVIQ